MNSESIKPLVSVCCITYNHVNFIRDAIEGFLMQQTSFPIEIIIHDDASTDGTADIVREYEAKYPNKIKPIYQNENQWSKGIKPSPTYVWPKAKGKYIALCEGDDYWTDPLKLQKQADFLEENSEYAGSFHETIVKGDSNGRIYGKYPQDYLTVVDTLSSFSPWHTSSFMFRKIYLELPEWFHQIVSGDMALFAIVAKNGKIKSHKEVMSVYRKHSEGITNTQIVMNSFHEKRIELMGFLNEFLDHQFDDKINEVINIHRAGLKPSNNKSIKRSTYWRAKNWLNKKIKGI